MKELKKAQMGIIAILTVMLVSMKRRLPEARRFSSGITTLTLAGIVLLVAAGSVSADMPINSLPFTADTADTVYYLTDNLTCTAGEAGITITASNVTIDGRGKNITGNVESCSCVNIYGAGDPGETFPSKHSGIYNAAQSDLTVKDLEIIGFCTGIVLGSQDVTGNTVTGCNIHHNGKAGMVTHGIHGVGLIGNTITKCEIHHITGGPIDDCGGGGNGIFLYGGTTLSWGNYNNVTCNYLHDNDKSGFFMKKKCQHCDISYNRATGNLEGGIVPKCKKSDYNTITYNNVSGNTIYGIQTCGSSNTIEYNTAHDNQYGIYIGASSDMGGHGKNNVITNNSACGNSVNDVFISQNEWGYTNTVDDMTCDNGNNATYCDDWNSNTKVSTYYDYDSDAHYSDDSADCSCTNPAGGKCACCNPGLFNATHAGLLNDTAHPTNGLKLCWLNAGDDINDCDPSITSAVNWYCDGDGDLYISSAVSGSGAPGDMPAGCQLTPGDDCNDGNAAVNPGATENCTNGIDDDCNDLIDCADSYCKPDLNITANIEERINDTHYNVNYTVTNLAAAGTCPAGSSNTSIDIDSGRLTMKDTTVPALNPGDSYTNTVGPFLWDAPNDTIVVCADSDGDVDETDEGNNCKENVYELISDVVVAIDPCPVTIGSDPSDRTTVDITLSNIADYGSGTIHLYFDTTYVDIVSIGKGDSTSLDSNKQTDGHYKISASNANGLDGDVVFANVTFKPMGPTSGCSYLNLVVETLYDRNFTSLGTVVNNCTISIEDPNIPGVTTPTASPTRILNDNGRARVSGTNLSTLSVWVTDDTGVDTVTINLTPIRGAGYAAVSMTLVSGTEQAGTWSVETNATCGVNLTHCLVVNATDMHGNSNTANCVTLEVLRRGDIDPESATISQDNSVTILDYNEIAKYTVGLRSMPDEFTAGTVPADSHNGVDMADALYIAMYTVVPDYPAP